MISGKVFLVGAGPGDPELLTLKAARILQSADIVLHDALVSPEVLSLIPDKAQRVDVGKRRGFRLLSQSEINALLVASAREHHVVVRLKGGDPLLFCRAAEEMQALRAAHIDFEVVPGISAAFGASASAQISLTDRPLAGAAWLHEVRRARKIAKILALRDRIESLAEFSHSLGRFQTSSLCGERTK